LISECRLGDKCTCPDGAACNNATSRQCDCVMFASIKARLEADMAAALGLPAALIEPAEHNARQGGAA